MVFYFSLILLVPDTNRNLLRQQKRFVRSVMGGVGYDTNRNRRVGELIVASSSHHRGIIENPYGNQQAMDKYLALVVFLHPDGAEEEIPARQALGRLAEPVKARFTRLHEQRASELISSLDEKASQPIDAVFQSIDCSTGILAMRKRPDLFRRVVLVDPAAIAELPPRLQFLREEWDNGNLRSFMGHREIPEAKKFEDRVSPLRSYRRTRDTFRYGNGVATYVSSQAQMLHEIAKGDDAPRISIVTSRFDHAYPPERILASLVDLRDVDGFRITNTRHGLGGRHQKLDDVIETLRSEPDKSGSFLKRLHFDNEIPVDYRQKMQYMVRRREMHHRT
jgi:pimeloyl-ACP methyl ester carboxylesterase